jgi:hypothetical protein
MASILETQDLYTECLAQELLQKTQSAGVVWSYLGGTQYHATQVQTVEGQADVTWDFYVTKTQIGNLTYKYTLDVKKDGVTYVSDVEGPLPVTNRDSVVKDLYETVEVIVLQLDEKVKETLTFIQSLPTAITNGINPSPSSLRLTPKIDVPNAPTLRRRR